MVLGFWSLPMRDLTRSLTPPLHVYSFYHPHKLYLHTNTQFHQKNISQLDHQTETFDPSCCPFVCITASNPPPIVPLFGPTNTPNPRTPWWSHVSVRVSDARREEQYGGPPSSSYQGGPPPPQYALLRYTPPLRNNSSRDYVVLSWCGCVCVTNPSFIPREPHFRHFEVDYSHLIEGPSTPFGCIFLKAPPPFEAARVCLEIFFIG